MVGPGVWRKQQLKLADCARHNQAVTGADPSPAGADQAAAMPTLPEVVRDLREVIKVGLYEIGDAPVPGLRQLAVVQAAAAAGSDDVIPVALAVEALVERSVAVIGRGYLGPVLQALYGMDAATRGKPAKVRRRVAARRAESTAATFERHDESRVLRSLATDILRQEATYRRTAERSAWADRPLTEEEKAASWEVRFGYYTRIQKQLGCLRQDVIALVVALTTATDETSRTDYLHSSLWRFARFLSEHEQFDRSALGGRWVLPEPEAETVVASAIYQVHWNSPFNDRGESLLRVTLVGVAGEELWPFVQRLQASPEGTELLGMWKEWASECNGDLDTDDESCNVHGLIDQAERCRRAIDEQWSS